MGHTRKKPTRRTFSVTLADGTRITSPSTTRELNTVIVVTSDNHALADIMDHDAARARRGGRIASAEDFEQYAAELREGPQFSREVHWTKQKAPNAGALVRDKPWQKAVSYGVIADAPELDAPSDTITPDGSATT